MRIISATAQTALDSGRYGVRCLVKISPSGSAPLCFWDDVGSILADGDTYVGAAGRFTIEASVTTADMSSRGLDITFSGLDSAVIAMIDGVIWHQRPVLVQRAIIGVDVPQVLHLMPEFSGFLDKVTWSEAAAGRPSTLVLSCESATREMSRSGSRTASDADQRERDSADGFFAFTASSVNTSIDWGQIQDPAPAKQKGGLSGLLDRIF